MGLGALLLALSLLLFLLLASSDNELKKSHLSPVTLTATGLDDSGVPAVPLCVEGSDLGEQLGDDFLVLDVP